MTEPAALPTSSTDRRAVENALHAWLAAATGVGKDRCLWQGQGVTAPTFPFATLAWISTSTIGHDHVGVEDLGHLNVGEPDIRLWAGGLRRVVLSVQVFADPKAPPEASALSRLETAVAKLALPTHRESLVAAGFGLVEVGAIGERAPGQYGCDVTGTIASNVTEDIFSIQTITVVPGDEGDLDDVVDQFDVPDPGTPTPAPSLTTLWVGASAVAIDTEAEVEAELVAVDVGEFPADVSFSCGAGDHAWVVAPSLADVDTFTVDGFVGGFVFIGNVTVDGVVHDVWRSTHAGLGDFTVSIS